MSVCDAGVKDAGQKVNVEVRKSTLRTLTRRKAMMVEKAMWRRVRAMGKGKPKWFGDKMYCQGRDSVSL